MKKSISYLLALLILLVIACNTPTKTGVTTPQSPTTPSKTALPQLGKSPIKDVIKAMTLEEKANLCIGMGFSFPGAPPGLFPPIAEEDAKAPEKVPGAAGRTHAVPRLGIPSIIVSDGPAGVRIQPIRNNDPSKTYYATAFPIGTALASTWDTALVHDLGVAFGNEVREYGIDVLLAPAMNIHRNALGVSGRMAAAIVNGVQSNGVGTSVKHFAGNNNEFNRMAMNVHVSERALREIYLKNFQITVQNSNPWTIMSSYNLINGTYTSQNRALLDTVLRKEWGFKGMIMSDWFGGKNAVEQMKAGNDLLMPGTLPQKTAIMEGIQNNTLSTKQLDENVERILNLILKTPTFAGYKYSDAPDLKAHAQLARKVASEAMILLKNTGVLPFKSVKKVALFGNGSYDLIAGGTGSGDVNKAYMVSLNDGLTNAKYEVDERLAGLYKTYKIEEKAKQPKPKTPFDPKVAIPEMPIGADLAVNTEALNDVAIITIGKNSGEFADRNLDVDFNLTEAEQTLIGDVSVVFHAKKKKVIVVLNVGGVVETASWRDKVDGIVLAWQGGQETGNAIVDVLSGAVNPSGKLPTTFPLDYKNDASSANFPGKELPLNNAKPLGLIESNPAEITYEEDIYVGYRYFNTYNIKTAYSFGYGMSYTEFSYSDLKLSKPTFDGKITATIKVTNSGKMAGKEVAQLYLRAPDKKMNKPENELKGFAKTKLLQPNQSETLTFTINASDLASFNVQSSSWIAEAGKYTVKIGSSSTTIKEEATFSLVKELEVEKVNRVLKPQKAIKQMRVKLP
jgi:beta-glucosidase